MNGFLMGLNLPSWLWWVGAGAALAIFLVTISTAMWRRPRSPRTLPDLRVGSPNASTERAAALAAAPVAQPTGPVPVGVSGRFASTGAALASGGITGPTLTSDDDRLGYIAERLRLACERPITGAGSQQLFQVIAARFGELVVCEACAEKVLETLRDGEVHSRMLISPTEPRCCISFVAWHGCHQEAFFHRYGTYLDKLAAMAKLLNDKGLGVEALLQIDAFVRENIDLAQAPTSLDDAFAIDVEFSCLPMAALRGEITSAGIPNAMMVNRELCTEVEQQAINQWSGA